MSSIARRVTVTLRNSTARLNPQDLSAITCWVGCSSIGTVDVMQTITSKTGLRSTAGYGPAVSGVAETLGVGGAPVYFVPSTADNVGVVSSMVKNPISEGVAFAVYGSKLVAGSTVNGDIRYQGLVLGATLTITVGTLAASVAPGTSDVTLAIPNATPASDVETFWLGADAGATAARAKVSATFLGTKATNAGNSLAKHYFDNGGVYYTPPASGYRVKHTSVAAVGSTSASYSTLDLTVALGTDAAGNPNDPVSDLITVVNAITSKIVASPIGDGTGNPGIQVAFQSLQYGSTAALVISGNPTDYMPNLHIECSASGALGTAQIRWTIDGQVGQEGAGDTRTGSILVPVSGAVALSNASFNTGLTATFTGVLEAGDVWDGSATAPTSSTASLVAAATAALTDTTRKFGVLAFAQPLALSAVQQIDSLIQTYWGSKFVEVIAPVRDRTFSAGAYTETDATYVTALLSEFIAFNSSHGLTALAAGGVVFADGYTLYSYGVEDYNGLETLGRPAVIPCVARNSAIPVHESLGRVASGSIRNVTGISHDERTAPGLVGKFIVTQTYDEKPGVQFFSGSSTTADVGAGPYTEEQLVSLACEVGRIAKDAAFPYINDSAETISVSESNGAVPKGALSEMAALEIEAVVSTPIESFLFKPKSDKRPSANRLPATDESGTPLKTVTAPRNYSLKDERILRLEVLFSALGYIYALDIGINLV